MATFDAIVVGAGSAGSLLAARLSDAPGRQVLILEAGPVDDGCRLPRRLRATNLFVGLLEPDRVWPLRVTMSGSGDPRPYLQGRGIGGSSSVNGMNALRGLPEDYDNWVSDLGCDGWSWSDVEEAFLAVEDDIDYGAARSVRGPLPLSRVPRELLPPLDMALRAGLKELGYPECDNYHAQDATGVSRVALTVRAGKRVSASDAYLSAIADRDNLTIQGDTVVDRVLLDGNEAVGVRTADAAEIFGREIFVCAGAIQSPAILLRSGIGADGTLPVGANLIDHPMTPAFELVLNNNARTRAVDQPTATSMLRYSSGLAGCGRNDMQIAWHSPFGATPASRRRGWIFGEVMQPFSRGCVTLDSSNPVDNPTVELRLLADNRDLRRLGDSVRRVDDLLRSKSVASVVEDVRVHDGDRVLAIDDLPAHDQLEEWLSRRVVGASHAVGTCRMGRPGDPSAVVDLECRVIGYGRIRVCDASVIPAIPRANPYLSVLMVAQRVSDTLDRAVSTSAS